jgi:hypothetical protein
VLVRLRLCRRPGAPPRTADEDVPEIDWHAGIDPGAPRGIVEETADWRSLK